MWAQAVLEHSRCKGAEGVEAQELWEHRKCEGRTHVGAQEVWGHKQCRIGMRIRVHIIHVCIRISIHMQMRIYTRTQG